MPQREIPAVVFRLLNNMIIKNSAAVELGRKRWKGTTKKARSEAYEKIGTPRVNLCGSSISKSTENELECPLCGVADKKRRCSKRSASPRTERMNWLSMA